MAFASTLYTIFIAKEMENENLKKSCAVVETLIQLTNEQFVRGEYRDVWKAIYPLTKADIISQYVITDVKNNLLVNDLNQDALVNTLKLGSDIKLITTKCSLINDKSISTLRIPFQFLSSEDPQGYIYFQVKNPQVVFSPLLYLSMSISAFILLGLVILLFYLRRSLSLEMAFLSSNLNNILIGKDDLVGIQFGIFENFRNILVRFRDEFRAAQIQLKERVSVDEANRIATQVAHDIRSPLSALNMVMHNLSGISEDRRSLIRNATQRINDIANDLLVKNKKVDWLKLAEEDKLSYDSLNEKNENLNLLGVVVDALISEKRIQFRNKMHVKIEADLIDAFGVFVQASATEISRIISNLINNSVESFNEDVGAITVSVRGYESIALIVVRDNGRGIPSEILSKVGNIGFSYGKEKFESSGSGLGLAHAKSKVEEMGGKISIISKEGFGTSVEIRLPRVSAPDWFASSIVIPYGATIVSIDDDLSIHQLWKGRLESLRSGESNIQHRAFTSVPDFKELLVDESMIFLMDYEFLNFKENGLEIIKDMNIFTKSILVTSRYEEPHIRQQCEYLGLKILPKQLAGFIPIEVGNTNH